MTYKIFFLFLAIMVLFFAFMVSAAQTNNELTKDGVKTDELRQYYEQVFYDIVKKQGFSEDVNDILNRYKKRCENPDSDRLDIFQHIFLRPFEFEGITEQLVSQINHGMGNGGDDFREYFNVGFYILKGFGKIELSDKTLFSDICIKKSYRYGDLDAHLAYIEELLAQAKQYNAEAFVKITADEIKFVVDNRMALLDSFTDRYKLQGNAAQKAIENNQKISNIMSRIDYRSLFKQAYIVSMLVDSDFVESVKQAVKKSGKPESAMIVAEKKTVYGNILIAGTGRNVHTEDYAVIYDLGGDDVYTNNQAASIPGKIPSAVIVDCNGDDAYESTTAFTQGTGSFGVGILEDLKGDDSYIGFSFCQAVSLGGVGVLFDNQGNDTYRGLEMVQGVSHWGLALLLDSVGADRYESHIASQAVGLCGGVGILADMSDQSDSYYCKGNYLNSYGTAGVFEGWGQGVGFGYRSSNMSGGVGILYDHGGKDKMEAGNFSQGGGYYFGIGILYCDGDSDDEYIGSRYAQGFSAHQAIRAMIEKGGNDIYRTRLGVAQGLAWDESVSLFIDETGNDLYEGGSFSQGASAQNGWVMFFERAGDDTYKYIDQALTEKNEYHGGKSIAYFVDTGGNDNYPQKKNNSVMTY
ncbi:MAG TPA: hypothetical protein PLP05_09175, partial [Sedimentisphaerales bacterium]|nr:hypothetical protein [Sedimentisphaerales bacterium]